MGYKGKYTAADLAPDQPKQMGQYTAADLDTSSSSQTPAAPPVQAQPGALSRLLSGATNSTVGTDTNQGVEEGLTQGLSHIFKHPLDSAGLLLGAEGDARQHQLEEAATHYQNPGVAEKLSGAAHHLYGAVPFLGPMLGAAADKYESGDFAGGTGSMTGPLSMFFAHPTAQEAVGTASGKLGQGVQATGDLAKNQSYKLANNLLGTGDRDLMLSKDPGRGLVQEGISGLTDKSIAKKVGTSLAYRGLQSDEMFSNPEYAGRNVDISQDVNRPFGKALSESEGQGVAGSNSLFRRLNEGQKNLNFPRLSDPETGDVMYSQTPRQLSRMSPYEANVFKRGVGRSVRWSPDADTQALNDTYRQVYGNVDNTLDQAVPGSGPLNQRLSDLLTANSLMDRNLRQTASGRNLFQGWKRMAQTPVQSLAARGLYNAGNFLSPDTDAAAVNALPSPTDYMLHGPYRSGSLAASVRRR